MVPRLRRAPATRPYEPVAQVVEQLTFNQRVAGSSPAGLTKQIKNLTNIGRNDKNPCQHSVKNSG